MAAARIATGISQCRIDCLQSLNYQEIRSIVVQIHVHRVSRGVLCMLS